MKHVKAILAMVLCLAMAGMVACAPAAQEPAPVESPAGEAPAGDATETPAEEGAALAAGVYEGEAIGNGGTLKMAMTIDAQGNISEIEVLSHRETEGIYNVAFERIPAAIIAGQTLAVDTVSSATLSSFALINAASECLKAAGADVSKYYTKVDAGEKPAPTTVEKTADVVIVGGGGAGLVAAISAMEQGASVIIIEKTAILGGNTLVCGGIYNTPDLEGQKQLEMSDGNRAQIEAALAEEPTSELHKQLIDTVKKEYDAYNKSGETYLFDSEAWYALQTWNGGDKVADLTLVKTMADNAFESYQWLLGKGLEVQERVMQGAGSLYPRTHGAVKPSGTGYIEVYKNELSGKSGCELLMETEGISLIQDETGRVTGVNAVDNTTGDELILHANNAVIVTTGGFAGNVEMRQKYCEGDKWQDLGTGVLTTNLPGITGDGIRMAEAVGANLVDMEQIQLLQLGNPKSGATTGSTSKSRTADEVIFVNKEGNRFVAEDDRRDVICNAILKQTDGIMYIIHDSQNLLTPEDQLQDLLKMGTVFKGETVAELAAAFGADAGNLQSALDGYNAAVDAGSDPETGRKLLTTKIEVGPFYAIPKVPSAHHTMGGVQINPSCEVLNAQGEVIPGLLAAGEVVGDIHGGNRLGGNAVVDTIVFGKIAGETAAKGA